MKTRIFAFASILATFVAFTVSCSSDGGDKDSPHSNPGANAVEPIKKARITGFFQKGPFVEGTAATLNELDKDLNPTGRPYQTLITDDKGSFELRNVELVSPYAHLIANGFYRNEVTGNKSAAPITLQAIVDLRDKDNVNVNILTHLEYYRVLDLVDGGMTVKAAKKQAQKEIFAVFGIDGGSFKDSEDLSIFGDSDADAALLAISILLLGDLSEADFTQRLMNFAQGLRANGGWDNEAEKGKIADWASGINSQLEFCVYDENYQTNCWIMPTNDRCSSGRIVPNCFYSNETFTKASYIRKHLSDWGLSEKTPNFEKYIRNYWNSYVSTEYGLEDCNASNEGMKKLVYDYSDYDGYIPHAFKCEDNIWHGIGCSGSANRPWAKEDWTCEICIKVDDDEYICDTWP